MAPWLLEWCITTDKPILTAGLRRSRSPLLLSRNQRMHPIRPYGPRMYNLVFFFLAGLVSAIFTSTGSRHSMAADDSRGTEQRLINASELDQLLTVLTRDPPQSFEIEVFSVVDRPKKTRDELEKSVKQTADELQAAGRSWSEQEKKHWIEMNVQGNLELEEAPRLARERFVKRRKAIRVDIVETGFADGEVTPSTPFWETLVQPGDWKAGDRREYAYCYGNSRNPTVSAWTKDHATSSSIRDIWRELAGCESILQELVVASCSEPPKDGPTSSTSAPGFGLSPDKVRALLQGESDLVFRVTDTASVPGQRLAITLEARPKGFFSLRGRYDFATITVDSKDFRHIYEQTIHSPNGDVVLKVTADGFDEAGIPREKTWERRRPDGLWEKTSYLILKANTAYDAPASEFEFNPPPGSKVSVIGKDGWGVSPSDTEGPAVSRPVNRLWGLNVLAVLVLAAFTIRKFLLRRQTAAGG